MLYIQDWHEGMRVAGIYLCKSRNRAVTKNGKAYENLVLMDKTGMVDAKIWEPDDPGIDEFAALDYIDIIGINNRNLKNFEVNLDASILLAHKLPNDFVKISESGISEPETVVRLRNEGFRGFLMGENFMKTPNPAISLGDFIQNVRSL